MLGRTSGYASGAVSLSTGGLARRSFALSASSGGFGLSSSTRTLSPISFAIARRVWHDVLAESECVYRVCSISFTSARSSTGGARQKVRKASKNPSQLIFGNKSRTQGTRNYMCEARSDPHPALCHTELLPRLLPRNSDVMDCSRLQMHRLLKIQPRVALALNLTSLPCAHSPMELSPHPCECARLRRTHSAACTLPA